MKRIALWFWIAFAALTLAAGSAIAATHNHQAKSKPAAVRFRTASGNLGPKAQRSGGYLVVVELSLANHDTSSPSTGTCVVTPTGAPSEPPTSDAAFTAPSRFAGAYTLATAPYNATVSGPWGQRFSFSGVLRIGKGDQPDVTCFDQGGGPVTAGEIRWWVAPARSVQEGGRSQFWTPVRWRPGR